MNERNYKKELGYRLYALTYRISSLFPLRRGQVFSIATHDPSETGNVRMLERYMEEQGKKSDQPYNFTGLNKAERDGMVRSGVASKLVSLLEFFLVKPYQMARAEYILMDNAFLPMAYLRVRTGTRVVQLWHGTGTIKKFGQDATTGWLHEQEQKINRNITHLIVNGPALVEQYAGAFGVPVERTYPVGLPRTDVVIRQMQERQSDGAGMARSYQSDFLQMYPNLADKKLLLYAPTFRDAEGDHPQLHLDLEHLMAALPEDYVVLLRLHPFVAEAYEREHKNAETAINAGTTRVVSVSDYPDLNELLCLADALITDYSSIVFEYALLDRPMYFVADDLDEFSDHGRGFYEPYEDFVPGAVLDDMKVLAEQIRQDLTGSEDPQWQEKRHQFVAKYYEKLDGRATERVYQLITR